MGMERCGWRRSVDRETDLLEGPLDIGDAADGLVGEVREGRGGEVEVPLGAAHAAVDNGDRHGLAAVCKTGCQLRFVRTRIQSLQVARICLPQMGLSLGLAPL